MCDYSLTSNPAESDMPTEAEPWQPVDVSDVEEKNAEAEHHSCGGKGGGTILSTASTGGG